jgi:hypothetical protein
VENLRAVEVFTPSEFPLHTYVSRDDFRLEQRLRDALDTPGEVVSVSGPSKSGKTVLIERVVGDDLIPISGAGIKSADQLWDRILDWMDVPVSTGRVTTYSGGAKIATGAKGEAGLPYVAKGSIEGSTAIESSASRANSVTRERRGMTQVIEEIAGTAFVVLIDDFHYIDRSIQSEVAREIKASAAAGVKICTASVPHRADDVVRGNPELRGRVRAVDIDYWHKDELKRIASTGFDLLNAQANVDALAKYISECSGSPQLMQALCLQTCFESGVRATSDFLNDLPMDSAFVLRVLEETSTRTDFGSLVRKMHNGPKTRGTERKEFDFTDGTKGDVYRCVLLAIAADPPCLSMHYNALYKRIEAICKSDTPQSASIYQACTQIARMALEMYPDQRVLEWDEDDIMEIEDPYFLFYLRWSGKLQQLAPGV